LSSKGFLGAGNFVDLAQNIPYIVGMKIGRIMLIAIFLAAAALYAEPASKDDLKTVIQLFEKRFDFLQSLLVALIALVVASPFAIEYMARRRTEREREALEKVEKLVTVMRELSARDPKVARAMHVAGLS
jgi:hypothetical protein